MNKEEEKTMLMGELAKARANMLIAKAAGSSIKKFEKQARKAIKRMIELGEEGLAAEMRRSLEERIIEVK